MMNDNKFILDPCCGPKFMWFNKKHPNVIYGDIREVDKFEITTYRPWEIHPDSIMSFKEIPYPDGKFKLVVFDPPHIVSTCDNSELAKQYGLLSPETWKVDLKKGFDECWRVLEEYGVLIFKWAETSKTWKEIVEVIDKDPLFHHPQGNRKKKTYWATFMKIPEKKELDC